MQILIRRRVAWTLAALTLAATLYEGYDPAGAKEAPAMTRCADGAGIPRALIRYDSGRTLGYCSIPAMFAQLSAQEQPGLVRAIQVLDAEGRWTDARQAVYPHNGRRLNYRQMLVACARAACI